MLRTGPSKESNVILPKSSSSKPQHLHRDTTIDVVTKCAKVSAFGSLLPSAVVFLVPPSILPLLSWKFCPLWRRASSSTSFLLTDQSCLLRRFIDRLSLSLSLSLTSHLSLSLSLLPLTSLSLSTSLLSLSLSLTSYLLPLSSYSLSLSLFLSLTPFVSFPSFLSFPSFKKRGNM